MVLGRASEHAVLWFHPSALWQRMVGVFLFEYWPGRSRSLRAPLTLRDRGQTWQALAVAVGAAQPVATIVQFQGRCTTSTGHRVSMSRGTFRSDRHLVGDTHVQASMHPQDRRPGDRSVRLFFWLKTLRADKER